MGLSTQQRAQIEAQILTKQAQLDAANVAYQAALESADTESYKFDSKEGSQQTFLRTPSVLAKEIRRLESDIDRLNRRLAGTGICTVNLRR